jgi:hypothetical protein
MSIQVCFIADHPVSADGVIHPAYLLIDFPSLELVRAISEGHGGLNSRHAITNVREEIFYSSSLNPFLCEYARCDRLSACYSIRQRHATNEDIILKTCQQYLSSVLLSDDLELPAPLALESSVQIIDCTDSIRHYIHRLNP